MSEALSNCVEPLTIEQVSEVKRLLGVKRVLQGEWDDNNQLLKSFLFELIDSRLPGVIVLREFGVFETEKTTEHSDMKIRMKIVLDRKGDLTEARAREVLEPLFKELGAVLQGGYNSPSFLNFMVRFDVPAHVSTTVSEVVSEFFSFDELVGELAEIHVQESRVMETLRPALHEVLRPVFPDLDKHWPDRIEITDFEGTGYLRFKMVFVGRVDPEKIVAVSEIEGVQIFPGNPYEIHGMVERDVVAQAYERLQDEVASFSGEVSTDVGETLEQ